jgi:hypothetical protein
VPFQLAGPSPGAGAVSGQGSGSVAAAEQVRWVTGTRARQADQTRAVERSMWQERVASERECADKAEQERVRLLAIVAHLRPGSPRGTR